VKIHELVECSITEDELLRAALADLDESTKGWKTRKYREEHPEEVALDAVFRGWCAVRDTYLEELTFALWEHYEDRDRLARHAEAIFTTAAKRYDAAPLIGSEGVYCNFDCKHCPQEDSCDREYVRDDLAWTAAGTIAMVLFLWQEAKGILPFPDEPSDETVLTYYRLHPNLQSVGDMYVAQPSLF